MRDKHEGVLWKDRKRNFLGLPWTFTKYILNEDRLFIDTGFFNLREDDVRLYRVTDMTLTRTLWQRITGTGTIHCDSADQTMRNFDIKNVKHSFAVKELLSDLVEEARQKSRVFMGESMSNPQAPPDMSGGFTPGMAPFHPDAMDNGGSFAQEQFPHGNYPSNCDDHTGH